VALAETAGGVEVSNAGDATAVGRAAVALLGAERTVTVAGRGTPAESLTVRVPEWAQRAVLDVGMAREQWDEFTDFGVTVFDSVGQQVARGPLDYAFGRAGFDVTAALQGHAITVELYPAFARDTGARPWRATLRVRFLLPDARSEGDGGPVSVVPGGHAPLRLAPPEAPALPEGFAPFVEVRFRPTAAGAPDAVRRLTVPP
jgi:hypothetical protein